jgi:DNA-binding SARP family transcriptional activator
VQVQVLGPSAARLPGGTTAVIGARKPRSVLAGLALRVGADVAPDVLADLVWGGTPPPGAHGTLHSYVSGLRRTLEPGLGPRQRPTLLVTTDHGYRLALQPDEVDAHRFSAEVRRLHRELEPLAAQLGTRGERWPVDGLDRSRVVELLDHLETALGGWTGEPYADLPDHPEVALARSALEELRLTAEDDRVLALLALGEHATVVAGTEEATRRNPLRERTWALHALALTRSGRQAEALAALRRVRELLADELGIDPGEELRELEQLVLRQDPVLTRWLAPEPARRAPVPAPAPPHAVRRGWDTVGREAEEAALLEVLDRADAGVPAPALLVGEPGIGKSRLVEHLASEASLRGFVVATGRCSQDDGAPPLWPWAAVLRDLDRQADRPVAEEVLARVGAPAGGEADERAQEFLAWDAVVAEVTATATERPVLLVLEDLHWADTASLRVLRHLLTVMAGGQRLAVVATRRTWPEPLGAMSEVAEAFARRHVTRLDLGGLGRDDARALVAAVSGEEPDDRTLESWHGRAGGNPFFLIELARLGDREPADAALATGGMPTTLRDVLRRRLEELPEPTRELLLVGAVMGRRFSLDVLAAVAQVDPEEVDERLAPARTAGLVVDVEAGTSAFVHALTRDAVAESVTPSRRARWHAQVARALEHDEQVQALVPSQERVTELAHHWLAAGPAHVGRAWRAAVVAAEQARRSFAHEEAVTLLGQAVDAHRRDPAGTPQERCDLLMARAADAQLAADSDVLSASCHEAIALCRTADEPVRLSQAAATLARNSMWLPMEWQVVEEDSIDDLRWALARLPESDSTERCHVMLSLAVQLYYVPSAVAEVVALADEGMAMARRIGEPRLLMWACRTAAMALWTPTHAARRAELSREALEAARVADDPEGLAVTLMTGAGDAVELADLETYRRLVGEAERLARRRRLSYVLTALDFVELSLAAMRGDEGELQRRREELAAMRPRTSLPEQQLHLAGIELVARMWGGDLHPVVDGLRAGVESSPLDIGRDVLLVTLARTGRLDELRERAARPRHPVGENWGSSTDWACEAEVAAALRDPLLAAGARDRLLPLSGRMVVSGISTVNGPVDGYLALASAVLGRREEAVLQAESAVRLADEWGLVRYADWFAERRTALGF